MNEQLQRCFNRWRELQSEGEPTLRQEIAYKDGFLDAVRILRQNTDDIATVGLFPASVCIDEGGNQ